MKADSIKHITDRETLSDIYSSLFMGRDVFLKTDGINLKVEFIRFSGGKIYLRIPCENYDFKRSAIYTRNRDEVAYSHIIPSGMEDDLHIFDTEGSQIYFAPRREIRIPADRLQGGRAMATHFISSFVIRESLMQNQARVDWLRQEILSKVPAGFGYVSVYFLGDRQSDIRMSMLMEDREPVFIADINCNPETGKDCRLSDEYTREIYYNDPAIREKNLISEITVPLMYRMMIPFGYVQINSIKPLSGEDFFTIKRLGMAFSESMSKDHVLFKPSDDTISVTDLSANGIGMIFKEESLRRHFMEDALTSFTAYLPDEKPAEILGRVTNISLSGKVYRIGCSIESIDSEGEQRYRKLVSAV